ncbi:uncharacterized protein LOC116300204 [Actinia tenebrosa]|uniref:Uncharacterized protein LOC116300204 n=1 Tax=Actinia tenebrosa TaxID=6105 RepID=A0A6P8I9Z6_ACTTE|nr:uncharacterized protein LOC116300204 [Actinia tenebrosa]XP_031564879.1 uncharacterized protein LOC116300204 [Actinia tenebrosa]
MFITVLYGDYQSLLCNPSCSVINLLDNIKERCGFGEMNKELDLTDETGLVLELTDHKKDDASKYLTIKGEYILVEKRVISIPSTDPNESSPQQEITYIPLLKRLSEKFPHYEARVAQKIPSPGILNSGKTKSKRGRRRKGNVD